MSAVRPKAELVRAVRAVAWATNHNHIPGMCGRVIQSSGPLRYGIVEGMDMRDSRAHNYPPRWNAAPSQDLLVIRRNHETGTVSLDPLRWGFIPHWCKDPNWLQADQCQVRNGAYVTDVQGRLSAAALHPPCRRLL